MDLVLYRVQKLSNSGGSNFFWHKQEGVVTHRAVKHDLCLFNIHSFPKKITKYFLEEITDKPPLCPRYGISDLYVALAFKC